ncbi:MAG: putative GNAT family N-acyltransferase [Pseudohongiellaceae bacterium]|jgi:predicted GNAT family N-acyltransferase|tara:strand:+ start:446 stop:868 length:423 start_codon:yes stop_codon:yes gene_type:complete
MISLQIVNFLEHQAAIQLVRLTVFTDEQGVDPALDLDGQDEAASQILVLDKDKPVATGRMLTDGHIGRIAVLAEYRKLGIGSRIIDSFISQARSDGLTKVFLGAQVSAAPFYKTLGFHRYGDDYMEANIKHTPMQLMLDI